MRTRLAVLFASVVIAATLPLIADSDPAKDTASTFSAPVSVSAPAQAAPKKKCNDSHVPCLIRKYWKADDSQALSVARCESRFDPKARNSCCDGVFQLHRRYHRARATRLGYEWDRDIWDPGKATRIAYSLWMEAGWGPWECRP